MVYNIVYSSVLLLILQYGQVRQTFQIIGYIQVAAISTAYIFRIYIYRARRKNICHISGVQAHVELSVVL